MGIISKLRSSFGGKQSPQPSACSDRSGGYSTGTDTQFATYLVPGSATVQVSGSSMVTTVASLQTGQKILGLDISTRNALVWAALQRIEVVPHSSVQSTIAVGLGADDNSLLHPDQVVLTRDRKKKSAMKRIRQLEIGLDSIVAFNADGLQWRGKKVQEVKKISSIRLSRDKDSTDSLYKLTLGRTDHALLMSCGQDSNYFFVVDSSNSTVDVKVVNERDEATKTSEIPKMEIKNTFINVELEADTDARDHSPRGIPRSYSDTDIQKLAVELELEDPRIPPRSIFANDDMLDLSSNHSSTLTSKSRASSYFARSDMSSISGGSITQVRVGTQAVVDEDGNQAFNGSNEVKFTDYSKLPVNEYGVRLSAASVMHQPGRRSKCRKCAFYNTFSIKKGKICKNGALCGFCHDAHDRFIHRR